jgi:hypothetical protein
MYFTAHGGRSLLHRTVLDAGYDSFTLAPRPGKACEIWNRPRYRGRSQCLLSGEPSPGLYRLRLRWASDDAPTDRARHSDAERGGGDRRCLGGTDIVDKDHRRRQLQHRRDGRIAEAAGEASPAQRGYGGVPAGAGAAGDCEIIVFLDARERRPELSAARRRSRGRLRLRHRLARPWRGSRAA